MTGPADLPPPVQLLQSMFGFMVTKCLSAVAYHNIPDALKDGPLYYTDLASVTGTDQRALHRVMRMLSSAGMFKETEPGTFALTPATELLCADAPGSMRDMAVMITSPSHWLPWGRMEDTLKTGESGPQHAFGVDFFGWCQREENSEQWEIFNAAMTSFSSGTSHAVADAFDFSGFKHIVDIGGGHGYFLKTILEKAPHAKGTLFDLPGVVEGADAKKLGDRIEPQSGDFFKAVPAGGDCYTLKHIIHDWGDEQSITILKNIAAGMATDGRVLLIETVMPDSPEPHPAKFMDVNMLAMTEGGCERTEKEYTNLFAKAGLKLVKIHPTASPMSVIEAAKA
ncbi:MAG: methyltransferase [Planctomycetes bacterium]|nr:methyltransferase [Planctomycetota bacterium]